MSRTTWPDGQIHPGLAVNDAGTCGVLFFSVLWGSLKKKEARGFDDSAENLDSFALENVQGHLLENFFQSPLSLLLGDVFSD